ncbi:polygalacturonase 1 beta-like protein 3 [Magnolia sinica]|uniref:polygalacturonase 1 beta-like protein 3 n=1 Tax=Magnolia sinica TaxID=86752 RepID=UPI00265874C4|nr:polygalacturonase 1 beta-like protein 3 [Magnolia sinica]
MQKRFLLFFLFSLLLTVAVSDNGETDGPSNANPLSPKAFLIRYWNRQIPNNRPKPQFLLSKASPLSPTNSAILQKLADQNTLSSSLSTFCSSARLFCFPDSNPSLAKHNADSDFSVYTNSNFSNYGTSKIGGSDSFKNYSDSINIPSDTFKRYSRDAVGRKEKFANYAPDGNVVDGTFSSYAAGTTGGSGEFKNYDHGVNVPNLKFSSYDADSNGHALSFSSYSDDTNSGGQGFNSYGRNGNGIPLEFASYAKDSNVIGSSFGAYSEQGNGANDTFTSYGSNGNVPENNFKSYGDGGNGGIDNFLSYRDTANVGDDTFQSYAKNSNSAKVNFGNYGKTFNEGSDTFTGYGQGTTTGQKIGFNTYGVNTTFKDYAKKGITFGKYTNRSNVLDGEKTQQGISTNRWVEPGKFFRESMLKQGSVMPMPDIKDKMPPRAFLPRSIAGKLPFSLNRVGELKEIFGGENSSMATIMENTLKECERTPSKDETKRCVASIEDMIDFAVSVLGHDLTVRSTENVAGSNGEIAIGNVVGMNGGRPTESVSCHQSLFPYMVYFCHSVPKVRVYEAEILDVKSKERINRGVAICHLDTSAWSEGHGAFVALKGKPGEIEVCHWIFENDMTWVRAH